MLPADAWDAAVARAAQLEAGDPLCSLDGSEGVAGADRGAAGDEAGEQRQRRSGEWAWWRGIGGGGAGGGLGTAVRDGFGLGGGPAVAPGEQGQQPGEEHAGTAQSAGGGSWVRPHATAAAPGVRAGQQRPPGAAGERPAASAAAAAAAAAVEQSAACSSTPGGAAGEPQPEAGADGGTPGAAAAQAGALAHAGALVLVADNNSGTYAPPAEGLPALASLLRANFPGLRVRHRAGLCVCVWCRCLEYRGAPGTSARALRG